MKRKLIFFAFSLCFFFGLVSVFGQDLTILEKRRHLISQKIEGHWQVNLPITERLKKTENIYVTEMSFRPDPKVLEGLPPEISEDLARFPIYYAGHMVIEFQKNHKKAQRELEFLIAEYSGHPWLLYLIKEEGEYVNIESNYLYIVSAENSENDLLFLGGDNPHEPFTAFERKKQKESP